VKKQTIISKALQNLYSKLQIVNHRDLNITEYNRNSLKNYVDHFPYYMSLYSQLLQKVLNKSDKPVTESTFIDYGGGCGILSFLAKEIGFKLVVYIDSNINSANDSQIISGILDIPIDHFICGDVEEFISKINLLSIKPDIICSFDVLEHIYDLESWIRAISNLESKFYLFFMTSANACNPFIKYRLKKLHIESEYKGVEKNIRLNCNYLNTSYLEEREKIIKNEFPFLEYDDIQMLSKNCRGLRKDDILKVVNKYLSTGEVLYKIKHPTNTCDPYTGSWTEKIIDLNQLKIFIQNNDLNVDITNSFYAYSGNRLLNVPKYILNKIIRILGPNNLFFSPAFTLEIQKPLK
jgi:hypothetical protein